MFYQTNNPEQVISYVISWARDLAIFGGTIVFGWKARDIFQDMKDFVNEIRQHMKRMDAFALRLETNHLKHMEEYLYVLAKDRNLITVVKSNEVQVNDVDPPESVDQDAL